MELHIIDQNTRDYNGVLDTGVYWLDFSRAGIRDWVNTENSTEFLLKFTTSAAGSCKIITEAINILTNPANITAAVGGIAAIFPKNSSSTTATASATQKSVVTSSGGSAE
jgi:hypothetical protein